ncbi:potassium transporter TrkA [Sphingomonas sp. Leaf412]|uniref:potassium channel family protein n=1 Tax=Sphingomonas sp. Leaf412 TaxID=1736370 RepID=UPI0006FE146D|nr:potassium channel family protein [Sphingomonas sp. Leaf412]KQT33696.1 potassium transporter TrkA [Sphingomonas sp. Leaf412]
MRRPAVRRIRDDSLRLYRRGRMPAWMSILWRAALVLALLGIALAVHWFDREGLRDNVDGHISFVDVLYFTMITVTTVGFGDIIPVTPQARLFDTFVVTPIRLFVWLIFLGTAYDFLFKRIWEKWRMGLIQDRLHDHVVVVGHGRGGAGAVRELMRRGRPAEAIVVVDTDEAALREAEDAGLAVLAADATRDTTLEAVKVARASSVIVAAGRDDTSILIVLTARRLAPHVPISVSIRSIDNEALAYQAGANTVINPTRFAGLLLAGSTHGPGIADYLADLAAVDGRVTLREREVTAEEIGRPLSALATGKGLRVHRGDRVLGFWQEEVERLAPGDRIVEVTRGTIDG